MWNGKCNHLEEFNPLINCVKIMYIFLDSQVWNEKCNHLKEFNQLIECIKIMYISGLTNVEQKV